VRWQSVSEQFSFLPKAVQGAPKLLANQASRQILLPGFETEIELLIEIVYGRVDFIPTSGHGILLMQAVCNALLTSGQVILHIADGLFEKLFGLFYLVKDCMKVSLEESRDAVD
jgi:hypothetical protein